MKIKKCPRCGSDLIEEPLGFEKHAPSEEGETEIIGGAKIIPSNCSIYSGSIDVYSEITKTRTNIYRCPNPTCGRISFDC